MTSVAAPAWTSAIRRVDELADGFLERPRPTDFRGRIPGIAYGILADGRLVHARGIGTRRIGADGLTPEGGAPDADTLFRIASMTKSFTAAAILALRDDGRLGLDDPIERYVPALRGLRLPTTDAPPVTIRRLLTMTAGFPTDDPWGDRQQGLPFDRFAELLAGGVGFAWTPGTTFEYSNLGYGILGRAIANVTGMEYREFVRERFLVPLGMSSTTYLEEEVSEGRLARGYLWRDDRFDAEPIDGYGALASMGGVFTTVADLARWISFFTDAHPPRDGADAAPLSRATRREMQVVQQAFAPEIGGGVDGRPTVVEAGYGFGLWIYEDLRHGRIVGHSGGYPGYGSNMRWHPASGLGVVVLTNARYAPSRWLATEVLESLLDAAVVPARLLRPAEATLAARDAVEALVERWDDVVAGRWLAMNVELDEPVARRRHAIERLRDAHGVLERDEDAETHSDSPADLTWWLKGERGRVRASILLTPEVPPRIQTLELESVPEPPTDLAAAAEAIVAALARWDASWPETVRVEATGVGTAETADGVATGSAAASVRTAPPALAPETTLRAFRTIATRFAPISPGPVVGGDGERTATWRLSSASARIDLRIERAGASGTPIANVTFEPLPVRPPTLPA